MKKTFFTLAISLIATTGFAQWNQNGNNISTTNNVGIGTATPQYKLDVNGDIKGSNNLIIGSTAAQSVSKFIIKGSNEYKNSQRDISFEFAGAGKSIIRAYRGQSWDNYLQLLTTHTNDSPIVRMHIAGNGNVGIGTENPQYKLDVNGDIKGLNYVVSPNSFISYKPTDTFRYSDRVMRHYGITWINDPASTGAATLWQSGFGGIKFFTQGQFRMGIDVAGNIGVGTAAPQYKLDVNGDIKGLNYVVSPNSFISYKPTDTFRYSDRVMRHYGITWINDPASTGAATLWQSGFGGIKFFTQGQLRMGIDVAGNVGIGTENPKNKLDVNGTIRAKEVKVELENWSDFVFDKDYKLPSLQEVEAHINEYKHLPDIPSEKQVKEEGVNLAEMQARLLQKIEELTLYVIKQEKKIEEQSKQIEKLEQSLTQ